MTTKSVERTVDLGLCISCEVCRAECPYGAIQTHLRDGSLLPVVDGEACTDCGRCSRVCPGLDLTSCPGFSLDEVESWVAGDVEACLTAAATDPAVRAAGVSGGVLTALLEGMLRDGDVDHVFTLGWKGEPGEIARVSSVDDADRLRAMTGSRYIPASTFEAARYLRETPSPRIAVVGTPCQFMGLLKMARCRGVDLESVYLLGLVCDRTMNYNVVRWFEDEYAHEGERLRRLDFRSKEVGGWPGGTRLEFDSGRVERVPRQVRTGLKDAFVLPRCVVCVDKLNRAADIVFGDCYIPDAGDRRGTSTLVVRSEKGADLLARHARRVSSEVVDLPSVLASQGAGSETRDRRLAAAFAHDAGLPTGGDLPADEQAIALTEYHDAVAVADLGRRYDRGAIASHVARERSRGRRRRLRSRAALALVLLGTLAKAVFSRRPTVESSQGHTVATVGAAFGNKGAHAMILTTMDGFARRVPHLRFAALSPSVARTFADTRYQLDFAPFTSGIKARLVFPRLGAVAFPDVDPRSLDDTRRVLADTAIICDLSGFRLGVSWGLANSLDYLWNVLLARALGIRYAIMPQSIGPLDYPGWKRLALWPFLRAGLRSPEVVYARETDGLAWAGRYTRANLLVHPDMVLGCKGLDPDLVYRPGQEARPEAVDGPAMGIIVSERVVERAGATIFALYGDIVRDQLAAGRRVYLIIHSAEDRASCTAIKEEFATDDSVVLLDRDMDPIELEATLGGLDFLVASRYHSVVHAYKQGVPVVVLGWAVKYVELAGLFGQERYVFDVRDGVDTAGVLEAVTELSRTHADETASIREGLDRVGSDDIFDRIAVVHVDGGRR